MTTVRTAPKWTERDGVISSSLTPSSRTCQEWITHFRASGVRVSEFAERVIRSSHWRSDRVAPVSIKIVKHISLYGSRTVTIQKIRRFARELGFSPLNPESGCLIRDTFTDSDICEMGLEWIVAMHEPVRVSERTPCLLRAGRVQGGRRLSVYYDVESYEALNDTQGFAFLAPGECL